MSYKCDPCDCLDMYYRDSMSWRKATLKLLCDILNVEQSVSTGAVRNDGGASVFPAANGEVSNIAVDSNGRQYLAPDVPVNGAGTTNGIYVSGVLTVFKRAFVNAPASQTDYNVVTAVANKSILVLAAFALCGPTATSFTFNSKSGGAGTAISPLIANDLNGGEVLPYSPAGWIKTNSGEGLTVTTGAGSATGILITYVEV